MGGIVDNIVSLANRIPLPVRQALMVLAVVFLGAMACGVLAWMLFGWMGAETAFAASFFVLFTFAIFHIVR